VHAPLSGNLRDIIKNYNHFFLNGIPGTKWSPKNFEKNVRHRKKVFVP
jgi:hypothetical protein